MGLVNARNMRKAKELLEKNRHKVGDVVGKAATKLDSVSGGKTANISKKAEDAARKYSQGGAADVGARAAVDPRAVDSPGQPAPPFAPPAPVSAEEMQLRQTEANIAAANALTAAATAANNMLQQAAKMHANIPGAGGSPPNAESSGAESSGAESSGEEAGQPEAPSPNDETG